MRWKNRWLLKYLKLKGIQLTLNETWLDCSADQHPTLFAQNRIVNKWQKGQYGCAAVLRDSCHYNAYLIYPNEKFNLFFFLLTSICPCVTGNRRLALAIQNTNHRISFLAAQSNLIHDPHTHQACWGATLDVFVISSSVGASTYCHVLSNLVISDHYPIFTRRVKRPGTQTKLICIKFLDWLLSVKCTPKWKKIYFTNCSLTSSLSKFLSRRSMKTSTYPKRIFHQKETLEDPLPIKNCVKFFWNCIKKLKYFEYFIGITQSFKFLA